MPQPYTPDVGDGAPGYDWSDGRIAWIFFCMVFSDILAGIGGWM